jgi:hypothetical protein
MQVVCKKNFAVQVIRESKHQLVQIHARIGLQIMWLCGALIRWFYN